MKLSRYNWLVRHNEELIAYNGFTNAIARVRKDDEAEVYSLLEGSVSAINIETISDHLVKPLIDCGFIIPMDYDELSNLQILSYKYRYDPRISVVKRR